VLPHDYISNRVRYYTIYGVAASTGKTNDRKKSHIPVSLAKTSAVNPVGETCSRKEYQLAENLTEEGIVLKDRCVYRR